MRQQVVEPENAFALLSPEISHGEQTAEPAPAGAIAWIGENVGRTIDEHQPRAWVIA